MSVDGDLESPKVDIQGFRSLSETFTNSTLADDDSNTDGGDIGSNESEHCNGVTDVSDDCVPSVGSAMHSVGMCKPCAWFWKQDGCQNGKECLHCHLCPRGSVKALKRSKKHLAAELKRGNEFSQVMSSVVPFRPPPGLEAMQPFEIEQLRSAAPAIMEPLEEAHPLEDDFSNLLGDEHLETESQGSVGEHMSIGSALHGSGECKPCSFFWKALGCKLGKDCAHCHLCPEGETKARKKQMRAIKKDAQTVQVFAAGAAAANAMQQQQALWHQRQMLYMQHMHHMQMNFNMQCHMQVVAQKAVAQAARTSA